MRQDDKGQFLLLVYFEKISENACDSSLFPRNYTLFTGTMSADESLGSHQINSFAALLEENLQTSSESSLVQKPQLKKTADEKRPQKGGKRKEIHTAFKILDNLYAGYCTPDKSIHGPETKKQRKTRTQKIKGTGCTSGEIIDMSLPNT